jgi:hypothetical protein
MRSKKPGAVESTKLRCAEQSRRQSSGRRFARDSDIDLLVLEPQVRDARQESCRLRESLVGLGIAVDLVVMSTERFEETKDVIGGIAYPANEYGKVIYEAA